MSMKTENQNSYNKKGIAIVRVSSRRQSDNTSHETQEVRIREYAKEKGIQIVEVIPITESAKDAENRPQHDAAVMRAKALECHHILYYMSDREARNLTDLERHERFAKLGAFSFHNCHDRKVLDKDTNDSDLFLRDIQGVQNKQYSRTLSAKIRDAQKRQAEDGKFPGNRPPLGYMHKRLLNDKGKERNRGTEIVPDSDPKRLAQVLREFELRAQGLSFEAIRLQIIREGLLAVGTPTSYLKSSIAYRTSNCFYRRKFTWDGKVYNGTHPLIIPKPILDAIDRIDKGTRPTKTVAAGEGIFGNGWLKCADCGCNVVHELKRKTNKSGGQKTYPYYHCTNGKRKHPNLKGMNVQEAEIWRQLEPIVGELSLSEAFARDIADALNETHYKVKDARKREMEGYRIALKDLDAKDNRAYKNFDEGVIDGRMFERVRIDIQLERENFTNLLDAANQAIDDAYLETSQSILELATHAKSLWMSRTPE